MSFILFTKNRCFQFSFFFPHLTHSMSDWHWFYSINIFFATSALAQYWMYANFIASKEFIYAFLPVSITVWILIIFLLSSIKKCFHHSWCVSEEDFLLAVMADEGWRFFFHKNIFMNKAIFILTQTTINHAMHINVVALSSSHHSI